MAAGGITKTKSIFISGPLTGPLAWTNGGSIHGLQSAIKYFPPILFDAEGVSYLDRIAELNEGPFPEYIVEDNKARPFNKNTDIIWSK